MQVPSSEEIEASLDAKKPRWWLRITILVVIIAGAAFMMRGRDEGVSGPTWETAAASRGDIELSASATGTLEPRRVVTIGSELSGLVTDVLVDENDQVKAGQVLARIDTTSLENQLAQAKASLMVARASIKRAQATLDEAKIREKLTLQLVEKQAAAKSSIDETRAARLRAQADLESARATLAQNRANVSSIEDELAKAEIRAPIDGVVLSRSVEPGNTVASSLQAPELFVVAEDLGKMELQVLISEADISLVKDGQAAEFTVDAWPKKKFVASVESVSLSPTNSANVVTYMTVLEVDNSEHLLRPGMTAATTIKTGKLESVLRIPNAALWFKPSEKKGSGGFRLGPPKRESADQNQGSGVYVLRDETPTRIALDIGRSDGEFVEVFGGELNEGDQVIVGEIEPEKGEGTEEKEKGAPGGES